MRICVPISVNNPKKALKLANLARKKADMVEIWLDSFEIRGVASRIPHLFICKSKDAKKLILASKLGADFVDIDINVGRSVISELKKSKNKSTKLIISYHNFKNTPDLNFLIKQAKHMFALGADIVKIATFIRNFHENAVLFELVLRFKKLNKKLIVIGMGEKGKISRIACPFLGSYLTYVALNERMKTEEGQFTLKQIFNFQFYN